MYLINKDEPLTLDYLGQVLMDFQTKELSRLNRYRKYYDGKQKIMQKAAQDGKPCNRIVSNYCQEIVDNYRGYIVGVPVTYEGENAEPLIDVLNYNDVNAEDIDYLEDALIYGVAYEVCYIDEQGNKRFRLFDPRQCIPVFSNTLEEELLYVIRFWKEDLVKKDNWMIEVYSPDKITTYESAPGFVSFNLLNERPHFFGQCPVTVFYLNRQHKSIFDPIMTLQDGYNNLISDAQDSEDAFSDCYMVLKGVTADDDELSTMKTRKILMMDVDADAEYLTKDINDAQFSNLEHIYDDQIYRKSGCPNFTDEKFFASSGIALRFRLLQFEDKAAGIVSQMKKALQRRLELLTGIMNLAGEETVWRDIDIRFTRNIPDQLTPTTAQEVTTYKGLVSDYTLLGLLPFVDNVDEELQRVEEQNSFELFQVKEDEDKELLDEKDA